MIVYPAIDLRGGKVVRLEEGDPARQTTYSSDPLAVAQKWRQAGAAWLHVINLDGAFGEASDNLALLPELAALGLHVQFGGGIRSLADAERALATGASRVVLGTLAAEDPDAMREAIRRFGPDAVAAALDARGQRVATHGWQTASEWTPAELGKRFAGMGAVHALYTDISRDGNLRGVNVTATAALARETGLAVIASGGVASLADVAALRAADAPIAGVIIGRALYTGAVALADALDTAGNGEV